ncbi:MAG: rRNA maturation RNase YbeY, partial [Nitrospirae bacterium]|nr:rRNA maturation RNase YbeY [Nitrospirota bacterium]
GVNRATDVLSFPQIEFGVQSSGFRKKNKTHNSRLLTQSCMLGDIVISIPTAARQAKISDWGLYDEIYRLMVHGILHLLGYDHEKSRLRAKLMRKKEREALNAIKKIS